MQQVLVGRVDSYADTEAIARFVRSALRLDAAASAALDRRDGERLVVVKPNWVQQAHEYAPNVWEPVITHPAVVTAVVEALAERLDGKGTIAICDAPQTHADFEAIVARGDLPARLERVRARWPSLRLEVIDLRREVFRVEGGVVVERRANPPDPRGYVRLDLGRDSMLYRHRGEGRYYGADYDTGEVNAHHRGMVQEYLIAGTPMACDLFVNLPKLKTHKKTGITCSLKNLVGINGDKNWLPHHTEGVPADGGDEFRDVSLGQRIEARLKRLGRRAALSIPKAGPWAFGRVRRVGIRVLGDSQTTIRNGNWDGNDTCWRMALDLNRALLYGNRDGSWREAPARAYLSIVDGIVGGEGNGPLCPDAIASGVMIAGSNPATVDAAACRLMGFAREDVPLVARAFDAHRFRIAAGDPGDVEAVSEPDRARRRIDELPLAAARGFRPHFGWSRLGHAASPAAVAVRSA